MKGFMVGISTPKVSSRTNDTRPMIDVRRFTAVASALLVAVNALLWLTSERNVLEAAYSVPDGGGYCALNDSGVDRTIWHQGSIILPASKGGSYCCGYTFAVAMAVADERGLLTGKTVADVRQFQRRWYGTETGFEVSQCAGAVSALHIGKVIDFIDAAPGDFVCFSRNNQIGHSVVFLAWLKDKSGSIIGIHYRSSQGSSGGVGNNFEYFSDVAANGKIVRSTVRIARLDHSRWARLIHPFS